MHHFHKRGQKSTSREKLTWLFDKLKGELILPGQSSFDISSLRFDPSQ